jgi:hypothetical protein
MKLARELLVLICGERTKGSRVRILAKLAICMLDGMAFTRTTFRRIAFNIQLNDKGSNIQHNNIQQNIIRQMAFGATLRNVMQQNNIQQMAFGPCI